MLCWTPLSLGSSFGLNPHKKGKWASWGVSKQGAQRLVVGMPCKIYEAETKIKSTNYILSFDVMEDS